MAIPVPDTIDDAIAKQPNALQPTCISDMYDNIFGAMYGMLIPVAVCLLEGGGMVTVFIILNKAENSMTFAGRRWRRAYRGADMTLKG